MSASAETLRHQTDAPKEPARLELKDATVRYGGLTALDHFSMVIEPGTITGVIGPNGSGKSTTINAIAGITRLDEGRIFLNDHELGSASVPARADLGIARTFQAIRLFDSMNVVENVMIGATRLHRSTLLGSVLRTPQARRDNSRMKERAMMILETFGNRLLPRLTHQVGTLSYANRRRVEISRALMLDPSLVLLDEPMAGMNPHESWQLAEQLPDLLTTFGASALLVEHKMDIVTSLCPDVYVLDHGVELAHGRPQDIVKDPAVQEAFLGVEH